MARALSSTTCAPRATSSVARKVAKRVTHRPCLRAGRKRRGSGRRADRFLYCRGWPTCPPRGWPTCPPRG
eukprot:5127303-Pleurochrysis_carterae.AAC.1